MRGPPGPVGFCPGQGRKKVQVHGGPQEGSPDPASVHRHWLWRNCPPKTRPPELSPVSMNSGKFLNQGSMTFLNSLLPKWQIREGRMSGVTFNGGDTCFRHVRPIPLLGPHTVVCGVGGSILFSPTHKSSNYNLGVRTVCQALDVF